MSRPISEIADTAFDDFVTLKEALDDARVLFAAIRESLPQGNTTHQVAHVGVKHCDNWSSNAETWIKRMESPLYASDADPAPQTVVLPYRVADIASPDFIPLAAFAKRRQHAAARDLGVEQAAISKAIRVGRAIFVQKHPDGTVTAIEQKPFPSSPRGESQ